tara:strand:+ start:177 stop:371 length:195 start_codon:yes stop_codon:yes gene_type:complete
MYLNIINNIRHESKRKNKKTDYLLKQENNNSENESSGITTDNDCILYYSVFYGDLTKNWIKLNN